MDENDSEMCKKENARAKRAKLLSFTVKYSIVTFFFRLRRGRRGRLSLQMYARSVAWRGRCGFLALARRRVW